MPFVNVVDFGITVRIIRGLITPWTSTKAYKLGIIDKNGVALRKSSDLKTPQEQAAYTILDRLIFKLKRILQSIPFVNRNLANYASALWLIKECYSQNEYPKNIQQLFTSICQHSFIIEEKELRAFLKETPTFEFHKIIHEDGGSAGGAPAGGAGPSIGNIANNAGSNNVAGFAGDAGKKALLKKKPLRRKNPGEPMDTSGNI